MDRIMRWAVPDDALHRGVEWAAFHPEHWVAKPISTETLNRNYYETHGVWIVRDFTEDLNR